MYTTTANRRRQRFMGRVKAVALLALVLGVIIGTNAFLAHLDAQRMPGMEKAVAAEAARIDARMGE